MNDKFLYCGSTAFAALALLLMLVNICLVNSNRNMQNDLNQRQAAINNSGTLNQINQALLQALAQASIDNNDKDIRDLLESQGFTLKAKAEMIEKSDNADTKKK